MKPRKFELKEVTLKVSQCHVCKFNAHRAEWTLGGINQPNDKRPLQATTSDLASSIPMNSMVQPRTEEIDTAKIAAEMKECEAKKAEALKGVQAYEQKIGKVQQELNEVQKVCEASTREWATEKSRQLRLT